MLFFPQKLLSDYLEPQTQPIFSLWFLCPRIRYIGNTHPVLIFLAKIVFIATEIIYEYEASIFSEWKQQKNCMDTFASCFV